MIARVLRVDAPSQRIDAVVDAYREMVRPIHSRAEGLLHYYVLGHRPSP
jgi:quinol monooxygenase YgiN